MKEQIITSLKMSLISECEHFNRTSKNNCIYLNINPDSVCVNVYRKDLFTSNLYSENIQTTTEHGLTVADIVNQFLHLSNKLDALFDDTDFIKEQKTDELSES